MKRVLLTGASGFVGANLSRRLLQEGHELHLLLRPGYTPWRLRDLRQDVHLHLADLGDAQRLACLVRQVRPEWVFHLAAHGAYSWQTDVRQMIALNISGTANLLEACLQSGFEVFVNTGSSSEYGFKNHAPSEREVLEPNSHYAWTKAAATHLCACTARLHNLRIPTLRLYSAYGPYEDPARLVPTLIRQGLKGELPPLVDPDIARDFVYVEDVCDAYVLAARHTHQEPGGVYNVGTGVQTTIRSLVEAVRHLMDIAAAPCWNSMPDRPWDTSTWVADCRRIREELGWEPRHTLEQGLRQTIEWFRQNAHWIPVPEGPAR
jgi:nucleoside-diphosphate-sugar epimerase